LEVGGRDSVRQQLKQVDLLRLSANARRLQEAVLELAILACERNHGHQTLAHKVFVALGLAELLEDLSEEADQLVGSALPLGLSLLPGEQSLLVLQIQKVARIEEQVPHHLQHSLGFALAQLRVRGVPDVAELLVKLLVKRHLSLRAGVLRQLKGVQGAAVLLRQVDHLLQKVLVDGQRLRRFGRSKEDVQAQSDVFPLVLAVLRREPRGIDVESLEHLGELDEEHGAIGGQAALVVSGLGGGDYLHVEIHQLVQEV